MFDFCDVPFGTRFVGNWQQKPVTSKKEIIKFVEESLGENIGVSSCVYHEGKAHLLFLPFDFDAELLKDSWEDAKKLYNYVIDNGYEVALTFSGNRGFHVYIRTKIKHYTHYQISEMQKMFMDMLDLKTMDTNLFGDIRRLMRLPGTFHKKTYKVCRILDESSGKMLDIDKFVEKKDTNGTGTYMAQAYTPRDYPCVEHLLRNKQYWLNHHPRRSFQPSQRIRYAWVTMRLKSGMSVDEILEEGENYGWDDWNARLARYQIEHIAGGDYYPPGCNLLQREGYCLIPNCPYKKVTDELLEDLGIC